MFEVAPEDPEPVAWTPEWRALAPALRGFAAPPPPSDLRAVWNALRRARLKSGFDRSERAFLEGVGIADPEALLSSEEPPAPRRPAEDARFLVLCPSPGTVDFLALQGGLVHAYAALATALANERWNRQSSYRLRQFAELGFWLALRRHVVAAPPESYAALLDVADPVRRRPSSAGMAARTILLFPDEPWAEEEMARAPTVAYANRLVGLGGLLVDATVEQARAWLHLQGTFELDDWQGWGLVPGLLAKHGAAAAPLLAELSERRFSYSALPREALAGLGALRTREGFQLLLERNHHREVAPIARAALLSHPRLGLEVVAEHLGRIPKEEAPKLILRALVAAHPALAAEVAGQLPPAAAAPLRALLADGAARVLAPPERWPEVLRSPPWERARPASPAAAQGRELAPLPYEESMTWLEHERETWLARGAGGADLKTLVRRHGFDRQLLELARGGDQAALHQLTRRYLSGLLLIRLEPDAALALWRLVPADSWQPWDQGFESFLATTDLPAALPALLAAVERQSGFLPLLLPVDSPRVAPHIARIHRRAKRDRPLAARWLQRHPRAAAIGLVPAALGKISEAREDALTALMFLAGLAATEEVLAAADAYGAREEIAELLQRDPLEQVPARIPQLPAFWDASLWSAPRLRSGEDLPPAAVDRLGAMLAFTRSDPPYAGLRLVREACDQASLDAFAWDLFQSWLAFGAPAREQWAMLAIGILGGDSCARRLTPLIRQWPGEASHARAVLGLEVLAAIGSDLAMTLLQSIADKVKFKGLQDKAREKIAQIAADRGLSADELADRLAPDLGLGEDGSLELDFGPRRFGVAFDEQLRPQVRDEQNKYLADLPKPKAADDAELAAAAVERFKLLKKDAKSLAGVQILRLELAMVSGRRFPREVFETFFARHPLIRHLARRLVWAAHRGEETFYFRIAEDGTYADAGDAAWQLPADCVDGLKPGCELSVPHPLGMADGVAAAFAQVLADYELLQPFAQLGRETFALTGEEKGRDELLRFAGRELPTGKLLGLEKRGWRRGQPQDGGVSWWLERQLEGKVLFLTFHDGLAAGDLGIFPRQTLDAVFLKRQAGWAEKELDFSVLSPLEASEMLRDLSLLFR